MLTHISSTILNSYLKQPSWLWSPNTYHTI